jgi:hypothetical protein
MQAIEEKKNPGLAKEQPNPMFFMSLELKEGNSEYCGTECPVFTLHADPKKKKKKKEKKREKEKEKKADEHEHASCELPKLAL